MLLIIDKGIKDGMYRCVLRYAKANNEYQDNYDKKGFFMCQVFR